jgi:hypothetical protein
MSAGTMLRRAFGYSLLLFLGYIHGRAIPVLLPHILAPFGAP